MEPTPPEGVPHEYLEEQDDGEYAIDEIRNHKIIGTGKQRTLEYLVHWEGYLKNATHWVNYEELYAPKLVKNYWKKKGATEEIALRRYLD